MQEQMSVLDNIKPNLNEEILALIARVSPMWLAVIVKGPLILLTNAHWWVLLWSWQGRGSVKNGRRITCRIKGYNDVMRPVARG